MKKQGNISIMVLFVLLASSLIWVLTMGFVNQMISSSNSILSYYKAYYISNAWIELLLTEAKNKGIWFEFAIWTWSPIFQDNFECKECDFTAKMEWRSTTLSKEFWKETSGSCLSPIVLEQGESLMIPLIRDTSDGSFWSQPIYENISSSLNWLHFVVSGDVGQEINVWLIILSGDELLDDGIFVRTWTLVNWTTTIEHFLDEFNTEMLRVQIWLRPLPDVFTSLDYPFKNYLILANTQAWEISFCIKSDTPLPTDNFHITSNGMYHEQTIWLELIYRQPIPSFLMNSALGSWSANVQ